MRVGDFVEVGLSPFDSWGIGKIASIGDGSVTVHYFDTPGVNQSATIDFRLGNLKRVSVPAQTRVWRRYGSGRWQVGRMLSHEGATAFVQFPNSDQVTLDTDEVFVRWNRPLADPLSLLISEATESPFLADPRSAFVREVARQRSAAAGVTALISSSVELEGYQFDVIHRVLTDPVQRYLLADEVGLGKTIEAGVIIRQHFLDNEEARAVVLVPSTLVAQWRAELTNRFGLQESLDDFLHVVSFDDQDLLEEVLGTAGLLVVDEAHHLSRWGAEAEQSRFDMVRRHSRRIPKLLLLSATPVLSDEAGFLRVLHLLDHVVFPLDDLAGFKRRIASRELIAEVAAFLIPENLWGLGPELDRLEEAYADDKVLCERITSLREVLDRFPDEQDEEYLSALLALRTHLLESYRLHRRMLRHRRSAIPWATVRRVGGGLSTLRTTAAGHTTACWDNLRYALNEEDEVPDGLCAALMECALNSRNKASVCGLLESHGLRRSELLALATAVDSARSKLQQDRSRFETLVNTVRDTLIMQGMQVVVFCDQSDDADQCHEALREVFGDIAQRHQHPKTTDPDDAPSWGGFLTHPEKVRVLVCDRSAEEGVNLHGGKKCAVHFDLPVAPNRIEQRMGRLDRYGKGDAVRSVVVVDEGSDAELLWADVVMEGWQIFSRSVASLQYLIESTSRSLSREWLHHGTRALEEHLVALDGTDGLVEQEIQQIDRHDALDALSEPDESSMDDLEDCDRDWKAWRAAFRGLAFSVLNFHERSDGAPAMTSNEDRRFRVGYTHHDSDRPTLLPLSGFLRHFLQSVDLEAKGSSSKMPLSYPYVFSRSQATQRAALADKVRLLRVGDPVVTALEGFSRQDDRGRAFAVWRADRDHVAQDASGVDLFFRFDFVATPSIPDSHDFRSPNEAILHAALTRKAGRLMPPCFLRIWVDGNGRVIEEPSELLLAPYHASWEGTRKDYNLNPNRWRTLPLDVRSAWMRDWSALCQSRRDIATMTALSHTDLVSRREEALALCEVDAAKLAAQAASRLVRLEGAARAQELAETESERLLHGLLREALSFPALQLDVVGAFFVSPMTLEEQ